MIGIIIYLLITTMMFGLGLVMKEDKGERISCLILLLAGFSSSVGMIVMYLSKS